jgi:hypothetical protein
MALPLRRVAVRLAFIIALLASILHRVRSFDLWSG